MGANANAPHMAHFRTTKGLIERVKIFKRRHTGMTIGGALNFLVDFALTHFEKSYSELEKAQLNLLENGLEHEVIEEKENGREEAG